jgi:large subunit ribosomal protein L9
MKQQEKARLAQQAAEKVEAEALAKKLESITVKVSAKAGEGGRLFGAVTSKEISESLAEQFQLNIAKTKLVLDEPIKACGGYQIKAKLGHEIVGTVNVMVAEN